MLTRRSTPPAAAPAAPAPLRSYTCPRIVIRALDHCVGRGDMRGTETFMVNVEDADLNRLTTAQMAIAAELQQLLPQQEGESADLEDLFLKVMPPYVKPGAIAFTAVFMTTPGMALYAYDDRRNRVIAKIAVVMRTIYPEVNRLEAFDCASNRLHF